MCLFSSPLYFPLVTSPVLFLPHSPHLLLIPSLMSVYLVFGCVPIYGLYPKAKAAPFQMAPPNCDLLLPLPGGRTATILHSNKFPKIHGAPEKGERKGKKKYMMAAGLGMPWDPPGKAGGSVRGEGSLGVPAQAAVPATWPQISG